MNQLTLLIQRIPKLLLGTLALFATLIFMVFNDPPTTVCDIQMKAVNEKLSGYFFTNSDMGTIGEDGLVRGGSRQGSYKRGIMDAFGFCLKTNSPGGCYDMFQRLDYFEKQIRTIPSQCGTHPSTASVKSALEKGVKLLVQIAWGEKPPETLYEKTAWLDLADVALFCRLAREHKRIYGEQAWGLFRESIMTTFPESEKLTRKEKWDKSLFSYPCQKVL